MGKSIGSWFDWIHKWRAKKPSFVVVSNSFSCPCNSILKIVDKSKLGPIFHFESLDQNDAAIAKFKYINKSDRILFYAHGDSKYKVYYKDRVNGTERHKEISEGWWSWLQNSSSRIIYFHVCFGSQILSERAILRSKFPQWVSYKRPVGSFASTNNIVTMINEEILTGTVNYVRISKNPQALKHGIESVYRRVEFRLHNMEANSIPGHQQIITIVGNNVNALRHS